MEPKTTTDAPTDWKKNSHAHGFAGFKYDSGHYELKFGSTFLLKQDKSHNIPGDSAHCKVGWRLCFMH